MYPSSIPGQKSGRLKLGLLDRDAISATEEYSDP